MKVDPKKGSFLPAGKAYFPNVTTNTAQQELMYNDVLPKMVEMGLIESPTFSEFVRYSIWDVCEKIGVQVVDVKRGAPGRKHKALQNV